MISRRLLQELEYVLLRPRFRRWFPEEAVLLYLARLVEAGTMKEEGEIRPVSADPKDDYLVALARAADADSLVSGDPHLHGLGYLKPLTFTPREYLDEIERSG